MRGNLCEVCGKEKGRNKRFCSKKCESLFRQHHKTCKVCGNRFYAPPSSDIVCCSVKCTKLNRQELHREGVYDVSIQKMLEGKDKFFEDNSGEKHINAKYWVIQSPDGKVYECQNLMCFIKNNQDLFEGTARQAFDGFSKIKASAQGKRKNQSYSWKGWRLLDWR